MLTKSGNIKSAGFPFDQSSTPLRKKVYELVNHLGNVLVTVADRKLAVPVVSTTVVNYYLPDVVSATYYSAFGAALPWCTKNGK